MKKWIALFLASVFTFSTIMALAEKDTEDNYDSRRFNWGDSREYVESLEGSPITEGKMEGQDVDFIVYKTRAVGLDVILAYYFCDDGLFQIRFLSSEEHSNGSLYIEDYNAFRSALTNNYGEPPLDAEKWEDDSKKAYYSDRKGDALLYGYLSYETIYPTERAYIMLHMSADNYKVTMIVEYLSRTVLAGDPNYSDEI